MLRAWIPPERLDDACLSLNFAPLVTEYLLASAERAERAIFWNHAVRNPDPRMVARFAEQHAHTGVGQWPWPYTRFLGANSNDEALRFWRDSGNMQAMRASDRATFFSLLCANPSDTAMEMVAATLDEHEWEWERERERERGRERGRIDWMERERERVHWRELSRNPHPAALAMVRVRPQKWVEMLAQNPSEDAVWMLLLYVNARIASFSAASFLRVRPFGGGVLSRGPCTGVVMCGGRPVMSEVVMRGLSQNASRVAGEFLLRHPVFVSWPWLCGNASETAAQQLLLPQNERRLCWRNLCRNSNERVVTHLLLPERNRAHLAQNASTLCENTDPRVLQLLAEGDCAFLRAHLNHRFPEHLWTELSFNPTEEALAILERHPDRVDWRALARNAAICVDDPGPFVLK